MRSLKFLVLAAVMGAVCSVAPAALFFEDFEAYDVGEIHGTGGWQGWDNTASAGSPVSDAHAYSGTKSIEIVPSADLVHIYDVTGGKWVFTAMQYIPSGTTGTSWFILLNQYPNNKDWSVQIQFNLASGAISSQYDSGASASVLYDRWVQVKCVIDLDENTVEEYYNGEFFSTHQWDGDGHITLQAIDLYGNNASSIFYDDIKIQSYLSTLTAADNPKPAGKAVDLPRDVVLEWTPGVYAATHDVYFGTSAEDVSAADRANPLDVLASQGQSETVYDPEGLLEFGQTYYWRVDEVNAAPDNSIFKGEVWSFQAEPFSYPITGIAATASSAHSPDMQAEKSVDGSGLNDDDQHSTEATHMWLSGTGDMDPWIQYEFDKVYKLDKLWVWNSNQPIESFLGLGAKDVTISYSTDGESWTVLEDNTQFNQATSSDDYAHNTTVALDGILAKYVKIDINAGFGMLPQYGLSELRFFYIPTYAREPQPADAGTSMGADVILSWRPGREAASHEVYLGTDPNALTQIGTSTDPSFAAGALDYATTYYWSVTEVNGAEAVSSYAGDLWSFTTPQFGTVDGFEGYDDDCKRIFFSWVDGFGHNGSEGIPGCNVAPSNGNGTSSIVGNDVSPFAEQTIVNSGNQSMPLSYDGLSETTLALGGQDWTASGVQTLSLAFRGATGNTGQLYVKINNTKLTYDLSAADIAVPMWQVWNIDLTALNGLQNVTSLTIGVENGGVGLLYIDDIRLYPQPGEFITPVEPDPANLMVYLPLDGDARDASGNNRHGTINGGPMFVSGAAGQALEFDGADDYVNVDVYQGIVADRTDPAHPVQQPFTISNWVKTTSDTGDTEMVTWGASSGTATRLTWRVHEGRLRTEHNAGNLRGNTYINDGEWHHVALVVTEGANLRPENTKLYVEGFEDTTFSGDDDTYKLVAEHDVRVGMSGPQDGRYFPGALDEIRIYDRALSVEEILWLAGRTEAIHKPFE